VFKNLSIGVLALLLAACGAPRPRHATPHPSESAPILNPPPAGRLYRIDESRSELRILVYRAGPLARLGHNHVMVNRSIRGEVNFGNVGAGAGSAAGAGNAADAGNVAGASAFSLDVPVAGFVVDDAQARREEGADFADPVPDDAKSGTLRNMLSTAVLDADEFPSITVHSVATAPMDAGAGLLATVDISVAGHESTIDLPLKLQSDADSLSATGSVEIRQSVLGLKPYSLMLGALQVQDAMTIKFQIVAISS
jgi:polyisoprenoid-binding protein YceI